MMLLAVAALLLASFAGGALTTQSGEE